MLHPGARILLYLVSALALPGLNAFGLIGVAVLAALFATARWPFALRLLWRARWLFLLLGLGYAYSLPGPAALPMAGDLSPSWPGVEMGLLQTARLALLLLLLDVLVVSQGRERMMSGLYGLLRWLEPLGFPAGQATVRVGLTLQAMEERLAHRVRLASIPLAFDLEDLAEEGVFVLAHPAWRKRDAAVLSAALLGLAWTWLG